MENLFDIYELRERTEEDSYRRLGFVLEDRKNNTFYLYKSLKDFIPHINLESKEIKYREGGFIFSSPTILKVKNFTERKKITGLSAFIGDIEIFNEIKIKDAIFVKYYSDRSFENIIEAILKN